MDLKKFKPKMNVWRYLALGYFVVVALGSVLLVLPFAAVEKTSYVDALFTSVSAACVTGLTPFETGVHWTLFGQIVLLVLIQLGGLGFMTFVSILFQIVKGRMDQYTRRVMLQSIAGGSYATVKKLVRRILLGALIFEGGGAAILCIRFVPDFGSVGVWYAVFHAVSAFCNAGFDILGGTAAGTGSLSHYAADPLVVLTVCALIIVGGLGFCVWGDLLDCKLNLKKASFYTRTILFVNALLLLLGTALFLLFESRSGRAEGYSFGEQLLRALFNSTTARTAGFYTTDPSKLSGSGYLLMLILMFIGGSSGSTAGGIKVGTFTVVLMGMISVFRGSKDLNMGKRRVDAKLLGQALAILTAYLFLALTATMIICAVEPGGEHGSQLFAQALFESVSALGTVGLSMNFTPTLSVYSKLVLILLMYLGRVGVLTFVSALSNKKTTAAVRRPVDHFYIG